MIYLDSSVALAQLLSEGHKPAASFWQAEFISSRLLEYEVWTVVNVKGLGQSHGGEIREFLNGVEFIELTRDVLVRATEPFPVALRALDALHLASIEYLRSQIHEIELASYDTRLIAAARALRIEIAAL